MTIELAQLGTAVVASVLYSIVFFAKEKSDLEPENFQPKKFLATIIVGVGVGISIQVSGADITFNSFETELAAYAGIIAITESLIKTIYREVEQFRQQ